MNLTFAASRKLPSLTVACGQASFKMVELITVAEDFAGLATATMTLQRVAKRLESRLQQRDRLSPYAICHDRKRFNIKPLYASESNEALRRFLKFK